MRKTFLIFVFCSVALAAKNKDRAWHEGTLVDVQVEHGSRMTGAGGTIVTHRDDLALYTIDEGKMIWTCGRTMTSRRDKMLQLTVNAKVKFAIEGDDCYLVDEKGEEHKVGLQRKELKKSE